jgi:hypothetical protein
MQPQRQKERIKRGLGVKNMITGRKIYSNFQTIAIHATRPVPHPPLVKERVGEWKTPY